MNIHISDFSTSEGTILNFDSVIPYCDFISFLDKSWLIIFNYIISNIKTLSSSKNIDPSSFTLLSNSIFSQISSLKESTLSLPSILQNHLDKMNFRKKCYITHVQIKFLFYYLNLHSIHLVSNHFILNELMVSLNQFYKSNELK